MIGAVIGDIVGSRFEWHNIKTKDFELFASNCRFTDDTVMSLAICKALMQSEPAHSDLSEQAVVCMQELGRLYPGSGYGGRFRGWLWSENPTPYRSFGNGSAMRVSGCAYAASSIAETKKLSRLVTEVTHDHPEGLKGAEAAAVAVYLARTGCGMTEIREYIHANYYSMDFSLDGIRDAYAFDVTCQGSVPQAIKAFLESTSFEDAIRNAISIGGDSDTIAAIAGGIAEAYYGVPAELREIACTFLDERLLEILINFETRYPAKMEKPDGSAM